MGWDMPWYTITDDFDTDFGVREWHGTNAFIRDGDQDLPHLLHRLAAATRRWARTWSYLDITALGPPGGVGGLARGLPADARRTSGGGCHDEYERAAAAA